MRLHFATIPMVGGQPEEAVLNRFLAAHRVVGIERHFVADGPRSAWALCVSYVEGPGRIETAASGGGDTRKSKVDYREQLSPPQFALYAQLRELRKRLAERDGVPPYAIVTNEQMAEIVRRDARTTAELGAIEGIGPARLERYAAALLEVVLAAPAAPPAEG